MTDSPRFAYTDELPWQELRAGVSRQVLGHDAELMMVRVRFEAGAEGALHHHPNRQAMVVECGRFRVTVGDETRELRAGDGFFVPPDVDHRMVALEAGVLVGAFAPARENALDRDGR